MKKLYNTPELNLLCVETKDVVTVSVGAGSGSLLSYSFSDIISGTADWIS